MLLLCISHTREVARVQKVWFVMNRGLAVVYLLVFTRKAWLLWSLRSDVGREDKLHIDNWWRSTMLCIFAVAATRNDHLPFPYCSWSKQMTHFIILFLLCIHIDSVVYVFNICIILSVSLMSAFVFLASSGSSPLSSLICCDYHLFLMAASCSCGF